jgi:hypothetical protein
MQPMYIYLSYKGSSAKKRLKDAYIETVHFGSGVHFGGD